MSELSRDEQPSTDLSELSVPAADAGQELSSAAAPGDAAAPARRTVPGSHLVEAVKDHLKVAVAAGAAFFAAAPDADGAVISDPIPLANYIGHGAAFPWVGGVKVVQDGRGLNTGSGVLITDQNGSPEWVLTAAHVVEQSQFQYQFATGSHNIEDPGTIYSVQNVHIHPDYRSIGVGPDLALLRLTSPVSELLQNQPPPLLMRELIEGEIVSQAGLGVFGTASTGPDLDQGFAQRHAGRNRVFDIDLGLPDFFASAGFLAIGSSFATGLDSVVAPGDSGGGWFVEDDDTLYLSAITSFTAGRFGYGSSSWGTEVGPFVPWINETTSLSVPEPGTGALLMGAGVVAFFRRPRSRG